MPERAETGCSNRTGGTAYGLAELLITTGVPHSIASGSPG
jgi:hypothetical protein